MVPQAGISWNPVKDTYLKLSASKGFRTPNMRELYMFPPTNKDLKPERAWSYDFAVDHHFLDGRLNTELSLFYTKGANIIAIVPLAGKPKNQNVGSFENMGVEASSDFRLPANLSIHANYSYLDMKPPVTGAPRHKLYCGLNYNPGRFSFQLGGMWIDHLRLDLKGDATESYVLVNARASYRLFDWMKRVVRGGGESACAGVPSDAGLPDAVRNLRGGRQPEIAGTSQTYSRMSAKSSVIRSAPADISASGVPFPYVTPMVRQPADLPIRMS